MSSPRIAAAALGLALGLACPGCFDPYEASIIGDDPQMIGIRIDVVEDGPYATPIGPLPADRRRAEVLPLDRVQLDALFVTADGPVDLDETQAQWFLCDFDCFARLPTESVESIVDCVPESNPLPPMCRAGVGARPELVLPDADRQLLQQPYVALAVVTGMPEGRSTADCVAAMLPEARRSSDGCGLAVREVPYGPPWVAFPWLTGPDDETSFPPEPLLEQLPPNAAVEIEEVEVMPMVDAIPVESEARRYSVDEVIELPADTSWAIEPVIAQRDLQFRLSRVDERGWLAVPERVEYRSLLDTRRVTSRQILSLLTITAKSEPGPATAWMRARDGRGGVSWFALRFEVLAP